LPAGRRLAAALLACLQIGPQEHHAAAQVGLNGSLVSTRRTLTANQRCQSTHQSP
jgi:hypothetical protein